MLPQEISSSAETGKLQVMHLKRYWNKSVLKRNRKLQQDAYADEWTLDITLLTALKLGLEQTIQYVYQQQPSFEQFENWIVEVAGQPDRAAVIRFNQLLSGASGRFQAGQQEDALLTQSDLDFWLQNGYVIIKGAVTRECCDAAIAAICVCIDIDRNNPDTWYRHHPARQGIMVQLFQHPALEENRRAFKIRKAFEELWGRTDLWVNTDRAGFNPPQTAQHPFRGPWLHWDVSIEPPIPFGTQGLLYLSDTAENQGAFTLVPGFQHRLEGWLKSLPNGADPRRENLYALGAMPVAANADDFIIWNQALPHGSSPNTATAPRFVQYINYAPADIREGDVWK